MEQVREMSGLHTHRRQYHRTAHLHWGVSFCVGRYASEIGLEVGLHRVTLLFDKRLYHIF